MAILNIRNLPDDVHARLRVRAARNQRSMEAEAREIIAATCAEEGSPENLASLQSFVDNLYGATKPGGVVDALIDERRGEANKE